MKRVIAAFAVLVLCPGLALPAAAAPEDPYLGHWALTIPGGRAGWLGVTNDQGFLDAKILWGGGSVVPVESVFIVDNALIVTRAHKVERKDVAGNVVRTQTFTESLIGTAMGDTISFQRWMPNTSGVGLERTTFTGKRTPPLPPAPDLSQLRFGEPVDLFNGNDLEGWALTDPSEVNGWRAEGGMLVNDPVQEEGKPRVHYGNLRTTAEFEDFNLTCEVQVPEKGNSGIYLRGIYEVQVVDSFGAEPNAHNMGGIYSRIAPSVAAEKPAGEWQTLDITLADRHVTVTLNGQTVIDNQPLEGCTGGALWSDIAKPGPIYLQGDHTGVKYRNLVLRPVVKG